MIKNNENKLDIDYQNRMKLPAFLTIVMTFSKLLALLLFVLLLLVGFYLVMRFQISTPSTTPMPNNPRVEETQQKLTSSKDVEAFCKQNGGIFLYELNEKNKYMECENIDEQICKQNGGTFDECASSCRHDPSAEVCIELCVPVCSF